MTVSIHDHGNCDLCDQLEAEHANLKLRLNEFHTWLQEQMKVLDAVVGVLDEEEDEWTTQSLVSG
jgi:hypothetical protein